jgi:hypothetical protein
MAFASIVAARLTIGATVAVYSKWSPIKRQKRVRPMFGATAEKAGQSWFVHVPGLRGFHTQVETLERAEPAIRQVIALRREIPAGSFDITVSVVEARVREKDD